MVMGELASLAAGILAAIGAGAILVSVTQGDGPRRQGLLKLGTYAIGMGGLVLMVGSIAGWQGADAMFCGLLMVVFGTGTEYVSADKRGADKPSEPIQ